ncbi:hypothetical protein IE077_001537 [Cardiosporidium cionae]|uniref:Uncharacterized protein n=1 Tax=Cardiosporidium cionae TaxID=476202 RepID=A0ABQ7JCU7_9APIC|nr:hypothetical protein IE077_001537 [Cardiosporidium cionae]|eukprot:KAF8821799.1 hypothetical protein IE077_001537 [Cardiosporidium cionae]
MPRIRKQTVADPDAYFAALKEKNIQGYSKQRRGNTETEEYQENKPRRTTKGSSSSRWRQLLAIAIVTILSIGGVFKLITTCIEFFSANFKNIPLDDSLLLKEIMFGGKPWLIYCTDQNVSKDAFSSLKPLRHSVSSYTKFGRIACHEPLPSGKTIMKRFSLPNYAIGFVVANAVKPQPLTLTEISSKETFVKFIKANTKPRIVTITDSFQLETRCSSSKSACLIVGQKQKDESYFKKEFLPPYISNTRRLKVFYLNLNKYKLTFSSVSSDPLKRNLPIKDGKFPFQAICLVNLSNPESPGTTRNIAAKAYRGDRHFTADFKRFLKSCQDYSEGKKDFVFLKRFPYVSKRVPRKQTHTTTPTTNEKTTSDFNEMETPRKPDTFDIFDMEEAEDVEEVVEM